MYKKIERINVLGVPISNCSLNELLNAIEQCITIKSKISILSSNVRFLNFAYQFKWLRNFISQAEIVYIDGVGVRVGAWLLGHKTVRRLTLADFIWDLAEKANSHGFTFFFLGARPGIAEKAAAKLIIQFPNLKIAGIYHGYFDKNTYSKENISIIRRINTAKPNILIIGFGMPLQERWLMENFDQIEANVTITAGGFFDILSGELHRGPRFLTDNGFEWLTRLFIEPRRVWKRYIIGIPLFLWRIMKQKFAKKEKLP